MEPALLPPDHVWSFRVGGELRHAFWRDASGLHVGWMAVAGDTATEWVPIPVVSSFDPQSGAASGHRFYDVLPHDLPMGGASQIDVAASPNGVVALAYRYRYASQQNPVERVLFVRPGQPDPAQVWTPPWSSAQYALLSVSWDGQAFSVLAYDWTGSEKRLLLTRLDPDLTTRLAPISVASLGSVGDQYFMDLETDVASGETVMTSAGSDGVWFSGHTRDGRPLPGAGELDGVRIQAQGALARGPAAYPAVAPVAAGEAVLAWYDGAATSTYVQRVSASAPSGDTLVLPRLAFKELVGHGGAVWLFGTGEPGRLDAIEITSAGVGSRSTLVTDSRGPCQAAGTCPQELVGLDARWLSAKSFGDELWFGFVDGSDLYFTTDHPKARHAYRLVRVAPGCVYPSLHDIPN